MKICDVCQGRGFHKEEASGKWVACLCIMMDKSPFDADEDFEDDEDDEDTIFGLKVLRPQPVL